MAVVVARSISARRAGMATSLACQRAQRRQVRCLGVAQAPDRGPVQGVVVAAAAGPVGASEAAPGPARERAQDRDPAVAAAHGYEIEGMWGRDFHASNPAFEADGHILDPQRPETLVYAVVEGEPVLLGAMFTMPDIGDAGPAAGGPLTVWHAHDHVCFAPPGILSGLQSPFGTCPIGSLTMPATNEMIHVWTVDGAPSRFGELDDEWLEENIGS